MSNKAKCTVVIVDDEEPARLLLKAYAQKDDTLEVLAVFDHALAAKKFIDSHRVDVLLTDIQMDDLTGIDLVKLLKHKPVVVFTTAYSEYALEGYDLDVVDYLVKPISYLRFCHAIDKAKELIAYRHAETNSGTPASEAALAQNQIESEYFFVKANRKIVKVVFADLLFVESYGEYVKLYTTDDVLLALQTTSVMEQKLPEAHFVRIHRSHIINLNHINEVDGNQVTLGRHTLTISKRMRDAFMQKLQQKGMV